MMGGNKKRNRSVNDALEAMEKKAAAAMKSAKVEKSCDNCAHGDNSWFSTNSEKII